MSADGVWPCGQGSTAEQPFGDMNNINVQDFANLLDFESFDFLNNFDTDASIAQKNQNVSLSNGGQPLAMNMLVDGHQRQEMPPTPQQNNMFGMQMGFGMAQMGQQNDFSMAGNGIMQNHHQMVMPPTPNSVEMHADVGRYLHQLDAQTRAIIEHEFKMRQQESLNFTPLGSPGVTPNSAQFNPNQFAVPGEYFSPLVSPALEGQHQHGQHPSGSTASTASPVDFDMDLLGDAAAQQANQPRRTRRSSASTRGASRRVAQSPIQKPKQKRKSGLSSVIPPKEVSELLEIHAKSGMSPTSPASARLGRGAYGSSSDSISPEPLSGGLMRPPPKPHSAGQSPAILANSRSPNLGPNGVGSTMPATPASLMRLHKDSPSVPPTIHEGRDLPMLDDLLLPDAADVDPRSNLPNIDTAIANGDATPRMSARKNGPKSASLSMGGSTPTTARPTPLNSTVTSPISAISSPLLPRKQSDLKTRASVKKRGSGNQLASPALLPRISPSIKPLLPSGNPSLNEEAPMTDQQHALLLTSRSNYQNLIEGRNIPGVTYPSDLPSQLTSKRTSHKIAEQGRRQRINVALQEMQCLLPKLSPTALAATKMEDDDSDDDGEGGRGKKGGKGGGNSKAATVEHAINYIKTMQDQERVWAREREEREKEVEALRKKLEMLERRLSVSKSPSASASASVGAEKEDEAERECDVRSDDAMAVAESKEQ